MQDDVSFISAEKSATIKKLLPHMTLADESLRELVSRSPKVRGAHMAWKDLVSACAAHFEGKGERGGAAAGGGLKFVAI